MNIRRFNKKISAVTIVALEVRLLTPLAQLQSHLPEDGISLKRLHYCLNENELERKISKKNTKICTFNVLI